MNRGNWINEGAVRSKVYSRIIVELVQLKTTVTAESESTGYTIEVWISEVSLHR